MIQEVIGAVGAIIKPAAELIDGLTTTKEEKLQLKNELTRIENQFSEKLLSYDETVAKAKTEIMVAELKQDDKFTKRARPWIIYGGLMALGLNHIILPWAAWIMAAVGATQAALPSINLPGEFWFAWGGAAGVYAFRRTAEKLTRGGGK
jgi:hypothetical protein